MPCFSHLQHLKADFLAMGVPLAEETSLICCR